MAESALVLLVEDSPTQAKEIELSLRRNGYEVVVAADGRAGLNMVYDCHPDLVVLDINLPEMDGFQVCRRVRRDPEIASIPIVMLTSADNSDSALTGLEAGADDYIPKDAFAVENLLATLQAL